MAAKKNPPLPFEAALAELEAVVGQLEHGELSLQQALQGFERGVTLVRSCQQTLQNAEQTVQQLIESHPDSWQVASFPAVDDPRS